MKEFDWVGILLVLERFVLSNALHLALPLALSFGAGLVIGYGQGINQTQQTTTQNRSDCKCGPTCKCGSEGKPCGCLAKAETVPILNLYEGETNGSLEY